MASYWEFKEWEPVPKKSFENGFAINEDPLSEELLQGKYKAGSTIIVSLNEEDGTLEFESVEAPNEPEVDFADSDS